MGNLSSRVRNLSISERRRRRTTTQSSSSPSPSTEHELSSIDNTTPVTLNATRTTPLLSFRSSRRTSSTRTNRSNGTSNSNATSNTVTSTNSNSNATGGGPQGANQNGSVNTPTLSNSSSSSSLQSNRNSVVNNTSRSSSFGDDLIHSLTGQELRVRRRNHETNERNTRHSHSHNHSSNSNPHDQTSSSSSSSPSDQSREQDLSEGTLRMFYASRRESSQPFALVVMFFQNRPEQGEGNSSRIRHPDRIWFLDLQQSEVNNTYESLLALQERLGFVNRGVSQDAVKGLQTIRYTNGLFEDERCPICLVDYSDDETLRKLPCGHCFHVLCVDNWLVNHWNSCPLCRLPIEEASTTA